MFVQGPKRLVARNVNQIASRTIKIPARHELLRQAAADRLLLNWFNDTWGKTKNTILDNWESAGLIKKRKPVDNNRKSAAATISEASKFDWKDKLVSQNETKEPFPSKTEELLDEVKNLKSQVDELSKARNKSQRHIAENWEAIKNANSKSNLLDNVRNTAKTTIDEVSKLLKKKGMLKR